MTPSPLSEPTTVHSPRSSPGPLSIRPEPRGPLSSELLGALCRSPGAGCLGSGSLGSMPSVAGIDALNDDDFQLALYLCYELHYRAMDGVAPEWEWDSDLLRFRAGLERAFVSRLRDEIGLVTRDSGDPGAGVPEALVAMIDNATGPSLSTFVSESGTLEQLREFCIHRSAYQLKEADPHTLAIPRLSGEAKAAMVEIQFDEYGSGDVAAMHSELFATTLESLGLDPAYGAYLNHLPGITLATVNLVSLFGLHRRWRAAAVGHLAVFEMTSIEPMARYSRALDRHGIGSEGRRFYDVHVEVDARHGVIALDRMVSGLMASDPGSGPDLLFGAAAVLEIEKRFTRHLLDAWATGSSSLLASHRQDLAA
jgi:Iron-containing redox enzyme